MASSNSSQPTDRELLVQLFGFLFKRNFILGDPDAVRDMVQRYKQPPVTMLNRVAMQLTEQEYRNLDALLKKINRHLLESTPTEGEILESA